MMTIETTRKVTFSGNAILIETRGSLGITTRRVVQNTSKGKFAVMIGGMQGWKRTSAIGDGITAALNSLVTRCETEAQAVELAEILNDHQPSVMPGSQDVPMFEAGPYRIEDYLSTQDQRNGNRQVDRRIANLSNLQ